MTVTMAQVRAVVVLVALAVEVVVAVAVVVALVVARAVARAVAVVEADVAVRRIPLATFPMAASWEASSVLLGWWFCPPSMATEMGGEGDRPHP